MKSLTEDRIHKIEKYMVNNDLTQETMAIRLNITRQYFNLLLNKNKKVSKKVALELERVVGFSYKYWLRENEDKKSETNIEQHSTEVPDFVEDWRMMGYRLLVDYEIIKAVESNYLKIDNFNQSNIEPTSYYFTIGDTMLVEGVHGLVSLKEHKDIHIPPGQCAVIKTNEIVYLPAHITGTISPTSEFIDCQKQIHNGAKVHPGYFGILFFTIFNNRNIEIKIDSNLKLLRIEFMFLPRRPNKLYDGNRQGLLDFPDSMKEEFENIAVERDKKIREE